VCIVVCDGLTGLPDAATAVKQQSDRQIRIIHLLRNTFEHGGSLRHAFAITFEGRYPDR
jgi:transposase-like protein